MDEGKIQDLSIARLQLYRFAGKKSNETHTPRVSLSRISTCASLFFFSFSACCAYIYFCYKISNKTCARFHAY